MSSTLRGYDRHKSDYYVTPKDMIELFIKESGLRLAQHEKVLDPCAGGQVLNGEVVFGMPYVDVISTLTSLDNITTLDIRDDSLAQHKVDFLEWEFDKDYQLIITNPPFDCSLEIAKKSIEHCKKTKGTVVLLQRLNFLGSKSRKPFFDENPPTYIFVHHKRPKFTNTPGTDSIEYAHFVWDYSSPNSSGFSLLKVI